MHFTLYCAVAIIIKTAGGTTVQMHATIPGGQEAVKDDESAKDVVKVAVGSTDHTTLVAALKQAELVTSFPMPDLSLFLPHQCSI